MNILVCISNVPDTTSKINFNDDNKGLNTAGLQFIINPYDEIALTRALELTEKTGGTVTVINVGDASTEPTIRKALAIGATDAVRINAAPRDAFFVASQIAHFAKGKNGITPRPSFVAMKRVGFLIPTTPSFSSIISATISSPEVNLINLADINLPLLELKAN